MGNGASAHEINAHVRRWESALGELNGICKQNQRMFNNSSALSNSSNEGDNTVGAPIDPPRGSNSVLNRSNSRISRGDSSKRLNVVDVKVDRDDSASAETQSMSRTPKIKHSQKMEHRRRCEKFFSQFPWLDKDVQDGLPCSHFGVLAASLSYLLGASSPNDADRKNRVTVEDLFFSAQIPLHYLHRRSLTLQEMYDIVREFIDVDNRFKGTFTVEVVFLDATLANGQVEGGALASDVGERQVRISKTDFRRELEEYAKAGETSIRIVNIDPFVVQEAARAVTGSTERDDVNAAFGALRTQSSITRSPMPLALSGTHSVNELSAMASSSLNFTSAGLPAAATLFGSVAFGDKNDGMFAAVLHLRQSVENVVKVVEAAVTRETQVLARMVDLPFNALFDGMCSHVQGQRARGFLRITRRDDESAVHRAEVDSMFSPELMRGDVMGRLTEGIHAHVVSANVSPFVVATAWCFHLLLGPRTQSISHGHGRGLPIADVVRSLQLPCDVFLNCSLTLEQVAGMVSTYIKLKAYEDLFFVRCVPLSQRGSMISQSDLEQVFIEYQESNVDPEHPNHVVMIMYEANVAHNALGLASEPQWAVLAGYNIETQNARFIDAQPKRFCSTWIASIDRVHSAMMGYGYIVVSCKNIRRMRSSVRDESVANALLSHQNEDSSSHSGATSRGGGGMGTVVGECDIVPYRLPDRSRYAIRVDPGVYFPSVPLPLTLVAAALIHLQVAPQCNLDDIAMESSFELNTLLDLNIEGLQAIVQDYLRLKRASDRFVVERFHVEPFASLSPRGNTPSVGPPVSTSRSLLPNDFLSLLRVAFEEQASVGTVAVIVHFDTSCIDVPGGHPAGDYGLILGLEAVAAPTAGTSPANLLNRVAVVMDCHPNSLKRTWTITVAQLFDAMAHRANTQARTRGCIVIRSLASNDAARPVAAADRNRNFSLALCPLQCTFMPSPSPHVAALSMAFAQLDYFASPEELFYEAFLKTVTQQRRRGSRAYAWRDVDISIGILNERISSQMQAQLGNLFLQSRKVSDYAISVFDDSNRDEILNMVQTATAAGANFVLLLNYDVEKAHGLTGMGHSSALVESFDAATNTVGLLEAQCALYGTRWSLTFDTFLSVANLDAEGRNDLGLVVVRHVDASELAQAGGGAAQPVVTGVASPSLNAFAAFQSPF